MDMIAIGFYACICGLLSMFAPHLGTFYVRLGVGAVVGAVSAYVLPMIKVAIGT